jgi:large subunit ribosomal protein L10
MPNTKNQTNLATLKDKLSQAKSSAIIDYQGVSVNQINDLRRQLKAAGGEIFVTKNTLINLAYDSHTQIQADLTGMNAVVLSFTDEVGAIKVAFEFQKDTDKLVIKSGSLNGQVISAHQVQALSKLPGKTELISQLLHVVNGPAQGLANVLTAGTRNLVYALQAIADQSPTSSAATN